MTKTLLVVHHSPTRSVQALLDAALAGAHDDQIQGVEVVVRPALEATAEDVLVADGYLLGTPANFGYMSGALKHFFDSTFLQVGGSLGPGLNLEGVTEWTPSKPLVNPWPFGSFALDSKENFIASCVAQFGERVGKGIVYNESNVGNLFEALTKAGVSTRGPYTALYPVTPL